MNDIFDYLRNLFNDIKARRYIESCYYDSGAAGKLFENLINKQLDNKCFADFFGIELKVSSPYNSYPITLFSSFPKIYNKSFEDSISYLITNFGYTCDNGIKKLSINVKSNKIKYCKSGYGFMLKVSYKWKKIYLCVFYKNKIICTKFYWSFEQLYEIVENKLKNLAYISYMQKNINGEKYINYCDMIFYRFKKPIFLIKAIEDGIISINFNIVLYSLDNIRYHGVNFVIYYKDFSFIYEKINK